MQKPQADPAGPRVLKGSGQIEAFSEQKLRSSLRRSGAGDEAIERTVRAVRGQLRDGMSTRQLFRIAHRELKKATRPTAARYALQRAILDLGPSGFPFERYVAELLRHDGWRTELGVTLQGRYVAHEVDIDARRKGERILCECKFREKPEGKVDVKVALYVHARAEDLAPARPDRFWLVTNGRFTQDALRYGAGVGLYLLSWNHPRGESLRERIDRAGLHPVTCLAGLRKAEKQELLRRRVVLCADLQQDPDLVDDLGLSHRRARQLWSELEGLCGK
jgi:hypothetical protein